MAAPHSALARPAVSSRASLITSRNFWSVAGIFVLGALSSQVLGFLLRRLCSSLSDVSHEVGHLVFRVFGWLRSLAEDVTRRKLTDVPRPQSSLPAATDVPASTAAAVPAKESSPTATSISARLSIAGTEKAVDRAPDSPRLAALRQVAYFKAVPNECLELLARHLQPVSFAVGETVVREGEYGDCAYFIVGKCQDGSALATTPGIGVSIKDRVIRILRAGDFFGELSLLTGSLRTATCVVIPNADDTHFAESGADAVSAETGPAVLAAYRLERTPFLTAVSLFPALRDALDAARIRRVAEGAWSLAERRSDPVLSARIEEAIAAEVARSRASLAPPRFPWRLGERLGSGASGVVHAAIRTDTGEPMAVKIIALPAAMVSTGRSPPNRSSAAMVAVQQESALMQRMRHPNVIRGFGCCVVRSSLSTGFAVADLVRGGNDEQRTHLTLPASARRSTDGVPPTQPSTVRTAGGSSRTTVAHVSRVAGEPQVELEKGSPSPGAEGLCVFMELLPLGSLDSLLRRCGPLSEFAMRPYVLQLFAGLAYLHREGVLHRDVKPANLLLSQTGEVKVADFGISRLGLDCATHSLMGTPRYLAPEAVSGRYSIFSDVWAAGCCLLEMATGLPPWEERGFESVTQALFAIGTTRTPPEVPEAAEDASGPVKPVGGDVLGDTLDAARVTPELRRLLLRLFALDPSARGDCESVVQEEAWFALPVNRLPREASPGAVHRWRAKSHVETSVSASTYQASGVFDSTETAFATRGLSPIARDGE